ncbi:MAG: hypothetical protein SH817_02000 [Leptospira sp.]|nr:hypothetical protein [Leptospira sp.]
MENHNSLTLIDSQTGNLAFKIFPSENNLYYNHFHLDFFFKLKDQKEISCNGILFNDIYHSPEVKLKKGLKIN